MNGKQHRQPHTGGNSIEQYAALVAQVTAEHPVKTFTAFVSDGDEQIRVKGRYNSAMEELVWMRMREIQRVNAALLVEPASTLKGIAMEAWHSLKYVSLHQQIDELYAWLYGPAAEVELLAQVASDRVKAVWKLNGLEELLISAMAEGDRLEAFAGDVVMVEEH